MSDPVPDQRGNRCWYNSVGLLHREDGPAFIYANGTQQWYVSGKYHRTDGPAIIWASGYKEWYVNGDQYFDNQSYQEMANLTDEDMLMITLKYGDVE